MFSPSWEYEDSPCKVTIFGPCLNPVWKHYVDNELFETGRYEGLIMADHKLVVDATGIRLMRMKSCFSMPAIASTVIVFSSEAR